MDWSEVFYYDETSPSCLRWKVERRAGKVGTGKVCVEVGDVAGCSAGYYKVEYFSKGYVVHRVIWELLKGEIPAGYIVDHIDGNKLNNKISNLRCILEEVNARNCAMFCTNTSGVTGVHFHRSTNPTGSISDYYVASWYENNSKVKNIFR